MEVKNKTARLGIEFSGQLADVYVVKDGRETYGVFLHATDANLYVKNEFPNCNLIVTTAPAVINLDSKVVYMLDAPATPYQLEVDYE